jgi:hypothetical protein
MNMLGGMITENSTSFVHEAFITFACSSEQPTSLSTYEMIN